MLYSLSYPIMAYEIVPKKMSQRDAPLKLTVRDGIIALNAAAGDVLTGAAVRFVHLLLDADKGKFAIRPIQKEDENAFVISVRKDKRGATISARSFLNYIGWQANEPVVLDVQWNPKERMMEASLPKEHANALAKSGKNRFFI
jgi:hypothetical protein